MTQGENLSLQVSTYSERTSERPQQRKQDGHHRFGRLHGIARKFKGIKADRVFGRDSLRTSHATWLKMAGADVKDAQAQMRHSRSSTTLDIYQQFVPESQQRAVEKLSSLSKRVQ